MRDVIVSSKLLDHLNGTEAFLQINWSPFKF